MSDYINALPNELLHLVFDRISLIQVLQLDQINPRWNALQPTACVRRNTLVLIIGGLEMREMTFAISFNDDYQFGFDNRPYYKLPAREQMASITLPFVRPTNVPSNIPYRTELARLRSAYSSSSSSVLVNYLSNIFPNVTNLVVIHPECNEHDSLVGLVGSWSLVTLKLWIKLTETAYGERPDDHDRLDRHPVHALLQSITKQASLQQLTLSIGDTIGGVRALNIYPAQFRSFVSQLKTLKLIIGNFDMDGDIWDMVQQRGNNLRQIGLGNYFDPELSKTVLSPRYDFTEKVVQLYISFMITSADKLSALCSRYRSLTFLRIEWLETVTFTELAFHLATLRHLTYLELSNRFHHLFPDNPFALQDRAGQVDGDEEEEVHRISLPSVKTFVLDIEKRSHLDFDSLPRFVFPAVVTIILADIVYNCTTCNLNTRSALGVGKCHREMLLSLKRIFGNSLFHLFSTQGFRCYNSEWTDWSNYLRIPDTEWPVIADDDYGEYDPAIEQVWNDEDDEEFEDEGEFEEEDNAEMEEEEAD